MFPSKIGLYPQDQESSSRLYWDKVRGIEVYNTDHDDITEEHNNEGDKTSDTDKTSSRGDSSASWWESP